MRRTGILVDLVLLGALSPLAQCQTEPNQAAASQQAEPTVNKESQASETKGTPPRAAPTDYQVQAQVGSVTIAADFAGHGVPTMEAAYSTEEYVVVEVAFFGGAQNRLKLSIEDFELKINDKKAPLTSQPFGYVAKTLKDPEWQPPEGEKQKSKTSLNGGGGDNGPVVPPKMPLELRRVMELRVRKSVLPEGDRALPVAGLIFFQYRGKTQSIKSMELIYGGPAGKASLPLQP
jgi:hypothetical protein